MRRRRGRRRRILAAALVVSGMGSALWAVVEPARLTVTMNALALPGWNGGPTRVALLGDLHVGSPFNGPDKLERIVERTNAARPDVVLLAGDFVIHGVLGGRFVPPESIATRLAQLDAPLGVFAVLGNHDWWLDAPRVRRALTQAGIVVLEDTAIAVGSKPRRFWLAGVSDFWEGPHDIARALHTIPERASIIVFTHSPDIFPDLPGHVTIGLAAHTHGGQVRLPIVGELIVPSRYGQRFVRGVVTEGDRRYFITPGLGTSVLPVRFRVLPEISVLDLVSAEPNAGDPG